MRVGLGRMPGAVSLLPYIDILFPGRCVAFGWLFWTVSGNARTGLFFFCRHWLFPWAVAGFPLSEGHLFALPCICAPEGLISTPRPFSRGRCGTYTSDEPGGISR